MLLFLLIVSAGPLFRLRKEPLLLARTLLWFMDSGNFGILAVLAYITFIKLSTFDLFPFIILILLVELGLRPSVKKVCGLSYTALLVNLGLILTGLTHEPLLRRVITGGG